MSNHAAIAAVTATLTSMIQAGVSSDLTVSGGRVTARPPDRARQGAAGNQVNLFLYRTAIDAAWRNQDPPAIRPGESGQPPLPLVLSYLVTAYGDNDDEILGHRLLGIAMGVLNDRPVLSRKEISEVAPGTGLDTQVERVRITPDPRPQDEISRMWATFGTGYRLSVSYDAAVVLIDSETPIVAPQPVLARGPGDRGPFVGAPTGPLSSVTDLPQIDSVLAPNAGTAARPGDVVTLFGRNLEKVSAVQVTGMRVEKPVDLTPQTVTATAIELEIPKTKPLPAGTVAVAAVVVDKDGVRAESHAAPLALAPTIVTGAPLKAKLNAKGEATLKVKCAPPVQAGQTVALIVGRRLVPAAAATGTSSELSFALKDFTKGAHTLRLRIDGVDSIPVEVPPAPPNADTPAPMSFDDSQKVVLT
jgi:hypothetical protein